MPLPAELAELVALIQDPAKREATEKLLQENHENGLRQSDYSRKMNEIQAQRKQYDTEHKQYVDWYTKAEPEYRAMQEEKRKAEAKIAELEANQIELQRLKAAGASGEIELTQEEERQIARELKATKDELKAARADAETAKTEVSTMQKTLQSIAERLEKNTVTREEAVGMGDTLGTALLKIVDFRDKYRDDFGKKPDQAFVDQFLVELKAHNGSYDKAYEAVTAKDRAEALEKKIEAKYEQKYNDRLKQSNLPIEQSGEPILGPLQSHIFKKNGKDSIPADVVPDGSGRLAHLIAQELRQEGKA
jgi:chromosome segregation ATPase